MRQTERMVGENGNGLALEFSSYLISKVVVVAKRNKMWFAMQRRILSKSTASSTVFFSHTRTSFAIMCSRSTSFLILSKNNNTFYLLFLLDDISLCL